MDSQTAALTNTLRMGVTTDPVERADMRTSQCDLRAAVAMQTTGLDNLHPATGHDYSPDAYRRALDSGANPARLDALWTRFKEATA